MTDFSPRRRGRPPKVETLAAPPPAKTHFGAPLDPPGTPHFDKFADVPETAISAQAGTPAEGAAPLPKRRRRAKVGGFSMKLTAPPREGYRRRWFNDQGNRLAEAAELGYEHVQDTGLKTSQPGSRVSRLVGTQANGEPLHAFLMETPDELYAEGEAEKEAVARQVDEAITRGKATSDGQMSQIPESETYGHGEIRSDR